MQEKSFKQIKARMFKNIRRDLEERLDQYVYPPEIASTFNSIFFNHFKDPVQEGTEDPQFSLHPIFFGQYFIDPRNPTYTRPFAYTGTIGCTELLLTRGVVARGIRKGKTIYVPNVTKDKDHIQCDEEMQGSELVIPTWSDSYSYGPNKGDTIPLAVLDCDVNIADAFTPKEIRLIEELWKPVGKRIFPGEPSFQPNEHIYTKHQKQYRSIKSTKVAYTT